MNITIRKAVEKDSEKIWPDSADLQSVPIQYIDKVRKSKKKNVKNKLGLIIGLDTDCKSALSERTLVTTLNKNI